MRKDRTILRCSGAVVAAAVALLLAPASADAQPLLLHGAEILKGCSSPRSNCNSNADCDDGVFCNGAEICTTPAESEPTTDCIIQVTNTDDFLDDLTLESAIDRVFPGTAEEQAFNIAISSVVDNAPAGDTTCTVGLVLGDAADAVNCVLGDGDVVRWTSTGYAIQPSDTSIPDQASVQLTDLCNGTPSGDCNPGTLNTLQANATTTVANNCAPGENPCPEDASLCNTVSCNEDTNACVNTPTVCNDDNFCTTDSCVPETGCQFTPVVCQDDGNDCNGPETCDPTDGSCDSGPPVVCEDPICTACNPDTGICEPIVPAPTECVEAEGRITGGGSVFVNGQRVTHGFELHCDIEDLPNNLEINWDGNQFHLEELTFAECTEDPTIDQTPPSHAPFDTYFATGVGRCNGEPGALITFTFVDGGEPGTKDTAAIAITGCPEIGGITVPTANLTKGNHQTHRD